MKSNRQKEPDFLQVSNSSRTLGDFWLVKLSLGIWVALLLGIAVSGCSTIDSVLLRTKPLPEQAVTNWNPVVSPEGEVTYEPVVTYVPGGVHYSPAPGPKAAADALGVVPNPIVAGIGGALSLALGAYAGYRNRKKVTETLVDNVETLRKKLIASPGGEESDKEALVLIREKQIADGTSKAIKKLVSSVTGVTRK